MRKESDYMNGRIMTISLSEYFRKRLFLAIFIIGLVSGTFIINTMSKSYYEKINVTQDHYIKMISSVVVDKNDVFQNGIVEYYREFVIIFVFNCFFFGKAYNMLYLFLKGAGIGVVLSSYVMKYGVKGMLVYIMSIFPHYVVYVPSVILVICAGISMRRIIVDNMGKSTKYGLKDIAGRDLIKILGKISVYMIIILIFAFFISVLEAYINIPVFRGYLENA